MEKCTDTVVDWMIRCNAINEADRELYKYALHSFFLLFSPLLLACGIGFCFGSIKQGIIIIIPFTVIMQKIYTLVFLDPVFYCFCAQCCQYMCNTIGSWQ